MRDKKSKPLQVFISQGFHDLLCGDDEIAQPPVAVSRTRFGDLQNQKQPGCSAAWFLIPVRF